jgi:hypothetical protein
MRSGILLSVAMKGRNFRPQNTKEAEKIVWGRENMGPNFWKIYQKKGRKGAALFL